MKKIILLLVLAISQFTLFADSCNLIFQLEDLYGDGWNGAAIVIKQNDVEVASVSLLSGSEDEAATSLLSRLPKPLSSSVVLQTPVTCCLNQSANR